MCCFNGWGSECFLINNEEEVNNDNEEKNKIIKVNKGGKKEEEDENSFNSSKELSTDLSSKKQCPIYLQNASNPGCVSNCFSDSDCVERSEHSICCQVGCGRKCKFPELANLLVLNKYLNIYLSLNIF